MPNLEGFSAKPRKQPDNNTGASERWWTEAACKDDPTFSNNSTSAIKNEAKKAVCNSCPVKDACLEDAMSYGDIFLFRAGKSTNELKAEYRRRKK